MDYFNTLPLEIQLDIFSRVPAESLLNDSKLVCKTWNDLVHHPLLPQLHLHRINHDDSGKLGFLALAGYVNKQKLKYFEYNQNHESKTPIERIRRINLKTPFYHTTIVGSCNGLICLDGDPSLYVCNPITREQVMLPEIQFSGKYSLWTTGFGYVPLTDEYKVIAIYTDRSLPRIAKVQIYTLGSGTGWRSLGRFDIDFCIDCSAKGVFANGNLYWIDQDSKMVITFNLAKEKFCEPLSTPPLPPESNRSSNRVGVLDGLLYFVVWIGDAGWYKVYDMWLLENKNDMKKPEDLRSIGWTKKFKLRDKILVAVTKSGSVLTHNCDDYLNIFDPKTSTSKQLVDFTDLSGGIVPHKNTLVSLKQLGEEGTEIMESIEIEKTESCDSPLELLEEVEPLDKVVSKKIRRY